MLTDHPRVTTRRERLRTHFTPPASVQTLSRSPGKPRVKGCADSIGARRSRAYGRTRHGEPRPLGPRQGSAVREGGHLMNHPSRGGSSGRSPVLAIFGSIVAGAALAVAFLLSLASGGSEPVVTGSVLLAFGVGWGLMAFTSSRFSAQPQVWTAVPAMVLGLIGLGLVVFQPGPAVMDLLSWIWPTALAVLASWMVIQVRRHLHGRGRWLIAPVIATLL